MNQKEISELRRRFRADRNAFSRVYGCFVNASREVISTIDEPLGMLPQEEAEQYLALLKKALSGTPGKISSTLYSPPGRWWTARSTASSPLCGTPV